MLHPSYSDLIRKVNSENEGDTPVVNSRYSIVMAAAKRARQIVSGESSVTAKEAAKPLSTAVLELAKGKTTILPELDSMELEQEILFEEDIKEDIMENSLENAAEAAASDELETEAPAEESAE